MIYISGLGVYGNPGESTIDETHPYNPDTNFVKIRLDAQKFLEEGCKERGINFCNGTFWRCLWCRGMVL